jgi:hypothetical protein
MASTYAPPTNRFPARVAAAASALPLSKSSSPILLLVATAVFIITALAFLIPQTHLFTRLLTAPSVPPSPAQLSPDQLEHILSYARAMQPDDTLVQVRPGVFAKHSNVHGVTLNGTTYYYDIASHQSFGPLRSGAIPESQVNIIGREAQPGFLVLVYIRK